MNSLSCQSCKRAITKVFNCIKCEIKLCSNNCLIDHTFESHQQPNVNKDKPNFKRRSTMKSPFLKFGEYLKEIRNDSLYDFKNFDFMKIGPKKLQVLGCGAFGDVYLTKNKVDNKYYAIKQMNKAKITEHGAKLDIVIREINIHRRLIHENIVRMYSHHEDKESYYIIMDYINSGTLFNIIKKKNGMDEKNAFKYFIHTAAAVNFLHENNLVHRDLKPENLLVDENGNVKLCDFGWCVELAVGNRSTFCGTYEYMAPEIINESPYNNGIDVWSLGVLLYELIHGYSPFRAKNNRDSEQEYIEIFKNIVKYNFKIDKPVSDSCGDLIKKLLSPETNNRIKVRDIFFHPWVMGFESEYKSQRLKESQVSEIKNNSIQNISVDNSKSSDYYKSNEIASTKNSSKNSIKIEEPIKENMIILLKDKAVNESLNQQIASKEVKIINKKQNEFSLFESNKDCLFDKVLNQVKEKNKSKKKKAKIEDSLFKEMSSVLENPSNNYQTNPCSNKIILVAERPKEERKIEEEKMEQKKKKEKEEKEKNENIHLKNLDQNNFSILNEMTDFENKIIEIEKNNKKFNDGKMNNLKLDEKKMADVLIPKKKDKKILNKNMSDDSNHFNLLDEDMDNDYYPENNKSKKMENNEIYKKTLLKDKIDKKINLNYNDYEDVYNIKEGISSYKQDLAKNSKQNILNNGYSNNNNNNRYGYSQDKENKIKSQENEKYAKNTLMNNKPKSLLDKDKSKKQNNYDVNNEMPNHVDKISDLNNYEKNYGESKNNLLAAMEILEKAQDNKNQVQKVEQPQEAKSFWSLLNPFRCGNNN